MQGRLDDAGMRLATRLARKKEWMTDVQRKGIQQWVSSRTKEYNCPSV
jgi:hypothetical protein